MENILQIVARLSSERISDTNPETMTFHRKLKLLMTDLDIQGAAIAKLCDVSEGKVSRWRKGWNERRGKMVLDQPLVWQAVAIADLLGVPIGWLVDDSREDYPPIELSMSLTHQPAEQAIPLVGPKPTRLPAVKSDSDPDGDDEISKNKRAPRGIK